jgi:hypothetical protein
LCGKSAPAGKGARLAEKPYNGLSAEKQSKKKKANAKSEVQKSQQEARWNIMRHPAGLYLAVKLDKTVYNGSERGEGGGGRGQGAFGRVISVLKNRCSRRQHPDLLTTEEKPCKHISVLM